MRTPIVAGNWKMSLPNDRAVALVRDLLAGSVTATDCEVVICPSFTALGEVSLMLAGTSLRLGAQNLYWERAGAFTGEVSAEMLRSVACEYVIVGHSERRWIFGEDELTVARKTKTAVESALIPIVCVGEVLRDRKQGKTLEVVDQQLQPVLSGLGAEPAEIVVAYEPVWAIGTGETASPEQAQEVHQHLRGRLSDAWQEKGRELRILYGGSVNPENSSAIMAQPDVDGVLVGGASLKAEQFVAIVRAAAASVPAS